MRAYILRSDGRLLLWSNDWLLHNPQWYKWALFATAHAFAIAFVLTVALLWFWPDPLTVYDHTVGAREAAATRRSGILLRLTDVPRRIVGLFYGRLLRRDPITREESRGRLLACGIALLGGYVAVRLLGTDPHFVRPFESYLPVRALHPRQLGLVHHDATFASGHAMLLGAVPIFIGWNRALGWIWILAAVALVAARVGVGFRGPLDMLAGLCLGALFTAGALYFLRRPGHWRGAMLLLTRYFNKSATPYCYYLYFLAAMLLAEVFVWNCDHLLGAIFGTRGTLQTRFFT